MRPIDADALKEHMGIMDATKYGNKNAQQMHNSYGTFMCYEIADYIDDMPTLDVQPVRRGEWRVTEAWPHKVYCTNCYVTIGVSTVPGDVEAKCVPRTNFCHECGADMRGERLDGDDT